ncbi:acetyltransferase [Streptomyces sp. YC504]|uniref:Lysine N-acyltransferase MbtK n=1 Tax=Streptomyces mesophilus TaxID=1775132 RepID=A0A6G4XW59_9ACTN|nr:GNAT family N-acetyltransferase [Streptomyces mesophilus]NGO81816.1 acetyltransferase [Streptomyces mesophilus]
MPPTDASTNPQPSATGTDTRNTSEDTLDLRLPDELLALIAGEADDEDTAPQPSPAKADRDVHDRTADTGATGQQHTAVRPRHTGPAHGIPPLEDLLDGVSGWGPASTPVGVFQLVPVRIERDLTLISRWMNDPAVAAFWELGGDASVTADHLRPQLEGDGRSVPCVGLLDGTPMSYWEIYRADLDPLARHYPARPHDTGIHLLIGGVADRGRGVGTSLLRAVADLVLDRRPACTRVVAEPDLRNTPSVSAFLSAGFRLGAEVELPGKRAALMVRDRALRAQL